MDGKTIRATNAIPPGELKDPEQFAKYAAGLVNEINADHPFLEGNGRTIRVWLQLFGQARGHRLDFTELSKERWYAASAIGFDTDDSTSLMNAIQSCLRSVGQTTELSTQMWNPPTLVLNIIDGFRMRSSKDGKPAWTTRKRAVQR